MNNLIRWIISIGVILLTVLLFIKGLDLWSLGTNVDGAGIGVHFLGFEVNDKVPEEIIPSYAIGFLISSFVTLIISVAYVGLKLKYVINRSDSSY